MVDNDIWGYNDDNENNDGDSGDDDDDDMVTMVIKIIMATTYDPYNSEDTWWNDRCANGDEYLTRAEEWKVILILFGSERIFLYWHRMFYYLQVCCRVVV